MKPVYIFRHVACEGPGYLADVLARRGIPHRLVRVDEGEPIPPSPDGASGLVFMGGPMSANDPSPWIQEEISLIQRAAGQGVPLLGHCLGGQLISKALGGTVGANPVREIGWHAVRHCDNPVARDWLAGILDPCVLFHWHGETFSLPDGAAVLLENEHCTRQAFALGNTLALQCHVEMTAPMVGEWAELYQHELDDPAASVQSREQMTADLDARIAAAQQVADILYGRWLARLR
jgi:GMP synthase-like glutamine amidotransferase